MAKCYFGQVRPTSDALFPCQYSALTRLPVSGDLSPVLDICLRLAKKMLRQILGIQSGDEVKELMLGRTPLAPNFSIGRTPLLIREHHQNSVDQAERSLVSNHGVSSSDL